MNEQEGKKYHLACGTVYLEGWVNIDIEQPGYFLAEVRPDLVDLNKTDYDHYYKTEVTTDDFKEGVFHHKEAVVDIFADITKLWLPKESAKAILAVQVLEHFDLITARELVSRWQGMLMIGGYLELHVPDTLGIIDAWREDGDIDWMVRQLYGSQKNEFSVHKYGYTWESLETMLLDAGYDRVDKIATINSYPSISIRAYK